jgi:hypothetical protein
VGVAGAARGGSSIWGDHCGGDEERECPVSSVRGTLPLQLSELRPSDRRDSRAVECTRRRSSNRPKTKKDGCGCVWVRVWRVLGEGPLGGVGVLGRWGHSRPDGTTDPREPGEGWQERLTTLARTHKIGVGVGYQSCYK